MRQSSWLTTSHVIIGVIALYALLLQTFALAAAPARADLIGPTCSSHEGSSPFRPDQPGKHDHQCCSVAQAGYVDLPPASPRIADWRVPPFYPVGCRPEASIWNTAPSTHAAAARGPPRA